MARAAQLGFADVLGLLRPVALGRRPHDGFQSLLNVKGAVLGMSAVCVRPMHHETAVIALARTQLVFRDLVTNRAGNAIRRLAVFRIVGVDGKMCEDLAGLAAQLCFIARNRHVTDRAFVFDMRLGPRDDQSLRAARSPASRDRARSWP